MMSSHFYKFEQNKFNRAFFYDKMLIQNVQEILLQINLRKIELSTFRLLQIVYNGPTYFVYPYFVRFSASKIDKNEP